MKAHTLILCWMTMLALLAVPAVAQDQHAKGSFVVQIAGGYWFESDEPAASLGLGYFFADQWEISLRGDAVFPDEDDFGNDDEVYLALLGLKYVIDTNSFISPYLGILVGGAFTDGGTERVGDWEIRTEGEAFVYGGLAGLEISIGKPVAIFVEYNYIHSDSTDEGLHGALVGLKFFF